MYRCLIRTTKTLRRNGTSLKRNGTSLKRKKYTFRQFTSISNTFKRNLSSNTKNVFNQHRSIHANRISITTPAASIICHKRHFGFNPNSTNPHRANDTIHSGSLGMSITNNYPCTPYIFIYVLIILYVLMI